MRKGKEKEIVPLLPEEVANYCGGGKKYGAQALAQRVVGGDISPKEVRKVVDVDREGNPIYEKWEGEDGSSILQNWSFRGLDGERHR
jgi:hypothetical protein